MAEYFVPADLCEDLLCCVICYEPFNDNRIPKALPCLHTFCSECLQNVISAHKRAHYRRTSATTKFLPCPVCNEICHIPSNGCNGFKDDFRIRKMSQGITKSSGTSNLFLRTDIGNLRPEKNGENDEKLEKDVDESVINLCEVCTLFNKNSDASVFCVDCHKLLCLQCSEKHLGTSIAKDHQIVDATEMGMFGESKCQEHQSEVLKYFCETCSKLVCMACTISENHTNHEITTLGEASSRVKEKLNNHVDVCQNHLQNVHGKREELEKMEAVLTRKERVANKAIVARTLEEITRVRNNQIKMENDLATICRKKSQDLNKKKKHLQNAVTEMEELSRSTREMVERDQDLQILQSHQRIIERLDQLITNNFSPDGSTCTHLGRYEALVEEEETMSSPSSPVNQTSIMSEIKAVFTQMKLLSEGKFDLKVEPIRRIGKRGNGDSEFNFPAGVAIFQNGNIAVADMHNHRVQIFDPRGNFKSKFGHSGFKPCGIAITRDGNIAVTDCKSQINCIKVFTPGGEKLKQLGVGEFDYPFALAIDGQENFIVSDPAVSRITVLSKDGAIVNKFKTRSKFTFYLTVNSRNEILLSDWYNHQIKVFDISGKLLRKIGSCGQEDGQLLVPLGITCDASDRVYVVDSKCERVTIFNSDGIFLRHIIGKNEGLEYARALALSHRGQLVITHGDNKQENMNEIRLYQV